MRVLTVLTVLTVLNCPPLSARPSKGRAGEITVRDEGDGVIATAKRIP